jgi:signal transduction histidine kinase
VSAGQSPTAPSSNNLRQRPISWWWRPSRTSQSMRDASDATVSMQRDDGVVMVQVADDSRGGADPAKGSGLRGLADRVSALNGRREVTPEPGQGTTIKATIPCG